MWWLRRYAPLVIALPLLLSCGFEPIYANRSVQTIDTLDLLAAVTVETPNGRLGELLKANIEDHFNPMARHVPQAYRLKAKIQMGSEPFVIEQDGTASRYTITLTSPYELVHMTTNEVMDKGIIRREVSYNVSEDDDYSTFITRNDMIKRGIIELAEDYKMRIGARMMKVSNYYRKQYEAGRARY